MSGYYRWVHIEFMDGTENKFYATDTRVRDGVLRIWTRSDYGPDKDVQNFPIANIKSWRWVDNR